jgi:hypothetical protein
VSAPPCCCCACARAVAAAAAAGKQRELCACEDRQPLLCSAPLQKREHRSIGHSTQQQPYTQICTQPTPLGNAPVRGRVRRRHGTPAHRTAICSRRGLGGLSDSRPVGFCQRAGCVGSRVGRRCTPCSLPSFFAGWGRAKLCLPVAEPTPALLFRRCRQLAAWSPAPVRLSALALHGCTRARTTRTAEL